ncbi:MAG TPA: nuclear transport factor 2 family protein [Rhizomicrobium sp.]|nr:nuclear transport factor 2 family protein [Rhizomicrobium sp.]
MTTTDKTRIVAEGFIRLLVQEGKVREAFETYVDPRDYIQHDPLAEDGRDNAIRYIEGLLRDSPDFQAEVKRILVDGDLFAAHIHVKTNSEDIGTAVVDIFRVVNGKIV